MNRHVKALTLLLAAQLLILVGVLWWQARDTANGGGALLSIDQATVDGILIEDDTGAKLNLARRDGAWVLPDSANLPADGEKVAALLKKLFEASAPWPVATSIESAKRFEVTPEKFQRHIQLRVGEQVSGDIYLGTSPGFRKVHARLAESDDVFAIDFANFEATARADDWLDKALLEPTGDVVGLSRPEHWSLTQSDGTWQLDGLSAGESTQEDAAKDLVNKVVNLRVMGIADAPPAPDSEPALVLIARTANGEFDYTFYQPQPKSDFVVTRSGRDGYFKVAAYIAEALQVERVNLVASAEAAASAAPAQPQPTK